MGYRCYLPVLAGLAPGVCMEPGHQGRGISQPLVPRQAESVLIFCPLCAMRCASVQVTNLLACGMMHPMDPAFPTNSPRKSKLLGLLAFVALCLLLFRFWHLERAPFLNDEPRLLLQVEESYALGRWPSIGPVGSQPIPYGPVPHWFYQIVRSLSVDPLSPHLAHGLLFLAAQLAIFLAAWFALGRLAAICFLALAASSPWLFVYSQMPWEVLLLATGSALAALSVFYFERSQKAGGACVAGVLWGLGIGISLGTHLMAVTLLFATAFLLAVVFVTRPERRRSVLLFGLAGFIASTVVLAPYLISLFQLENLSSTTKTERWGNTKHLWWSLVKSPMYLSPWQMKYFVMPQEQEFYRHLGFIMNKIYYMDVTGWVAKFFVWGAGGLVLFRWLKGRPVHLLLAFGACGMVFHVLQLQYMNIATYPHYFLPFWWAPFLLLSAFTERKVVLALVVAVVTVNVLFLYQFQDFLKANAGTQGDYYGSFVSDQENVFRSICLEVEGQERVDLSSVRVRHFSANYFFQRLPECVGKNLTSSEVALLGKRIVLLYAEPGRARLKWERAQ